MQKLLIPENEAEAIALKKLLGEHGIQAVIRTFHDSAFDGIFQQKYGWGALMVAGEDLEEARRIIADWRRSAPRSRDLPWQDGD